MNVSKRLEKLEARQAQRTPRDKNTCWDPSNLANTLEALQAGDLSSIENEPEEYKRTMTALSAAVHKEAYRRGMGAITNNQNGANEHE